MTRLPLALLSSGALAAAAFITGAAIAQSDPHQPVNNGSAAASATVPPGQIAPGMDPGTASANGAVKGAIAHTQMRNATNQAQYAIDRANYDKAMAAHGRAIAHQDAHYNHQQQAYADAMEAWRIQTIQCKRGHMKACKAPTPDPANFY